MKQLIITLIVAVFTFSSCEKMGIIKNVEDVCTQMDDINFMDYCYQKFDVNKDSKVSMEEAAAVSTISIGSKGIRSLTGIAYFTQLTSLSCRNNQLTSLDVSKNTQLTSLDCRNNQLTSLDVSKNTQLTFLSCGNNQLTSLDVSKNTLLEELYCEENELTSLDVSKNTQLTFLSCYNNQLTSLDISANKKLGTKLINPQKTGNITITR